MNDTGDAPLLVAAVIPVSFAGIVAAAMSTLLFAVTNDPSDAAFSLSIASVCGVAFDWHMRRYGYRSTDKRPQEDA